jgi:hypothetical protein
MTLESTALSAVQINESEILIFGGFYENKDKSNDAFFSKRLLTFNVHNETFKVYETNLPMDFGNSNNCSAVV